MAPLKSCMIYILGRLFRLWTWKEGRASYNSITNATLSLTHRCRIWTDYVIPIFKNSSIYSSAPEGRFMFSEARRLGNEPEERQRLDVTSLYDNEVSECVSDGEDNVMTKTVRLL